MSTITRTTQSMPPIGRHEHPPSHDVGRPNHPASVNSTSTALTPIVIQTITRREWSGGATGSMASGRGGSWSPGMVDITCAR